MLLCTRDETARVDSIPTTTRRVLLIGVVVHRSLIRRREKWRIEALSFSSTSHSTAAAAAWLPIKRKHTAASPPKVSSTRPPLPPPPSSSFVVIKFSSSSKIYSSAGMQYQSIQSPIPGRTITLTAATNEPGSGTGCAAYALEHIEKLMRRRCSITREGAAACMSVLVTNSCTIENFSDRFTTTSRAFWGGYCPSICECILMYVAYYVSWGGDGVAYQYIYTPPLLVER